MPYRIQKNIPYEAKREQKNQSEEISTMRRMPVGSSFKVPETKVGTLRNLVAIINGFYDMAMFSVKKDAKGDMRCWCLKNKEYHK